MIIINKRFIDEMVEHAKKQAPAEACGLLSGINKKIDNLYRMTNIDESNKKYLMDPKEQFKAFKKIRDNSKKLIGIYHSHVSSKAYPSQTDLGMAMYDVAYFIVSLEFEDPCIKAYRIRNGVVSKQEFEVIENE